MNFRLALLILMSIMLLIVNGAKQEEGVKEDAVTVKENQNGTVALKQAVYASAPAILSPGANQEEGVKEDAVTVEENQNGTVALQQTVNASAPAILSPGTKQEAVPVDVVAVKQLEPDNIDQKKIAKIEKVGDDSPKAAAGKAPKPPVQVHSTAASGRMEPYCVLLTCFVATSLAMLAAK